MPPRGEAGIAATLWNNIRAAGPAPPGVLRVAAGLVLVTLVVVGMLLWLGVRGHGNAAWYFYEHRAGTFYSGGLLLTSAALSVWTARRAGGAGVATFWLGTAVGFFFLAADELTAIHEDLDKWLHRWFGWADDDPLTDRIDAAIVVLYGAAAVAWALRYRDALLRLRWATRLMSFALVGFLVTTVFDVLEVSTAAEESVKLVTEALIVAALFAAGRDPALSHGAGGPSTRRDTGT
jgi:hypothetical protein